MQLTPKLSLSITLDRKNILPDEIPLRYIAASEICHTRVLTPVKGKDL